MGRQMKQTDIKISSGGDHSLKESKSGDFDREHWISAALKDSSVKRHRRRVNGSVKAHGGRWCMAHPGAQRGSSPEEKGLLGGEEGTPPAEVAWSQSSRATNYLR